jgi:hypothetical protein
MVDVESSRKTGVKVAYCFLLTWVVRWEATRVVVAEASAMVLVVKARKVEKAHVSCYSSRCQLAQVWTSCSRY